MDLFAYTQINSLHDILDSTGVLELILFLEETWGIQVADIEMVPENLETLDNIDAFERARQLGFDLFQGYAFAHPTIDTTQNTTATPTATTSLDSTIVRRGTGLASR